MNEDNQDSTSGNLPDFDSPDASSLLSQQMDSDQTIAPLAENVAPPVENVAPLVLTTATPIQFIIPFEQILAQLLRILPVLPTIVNIRQTLLPIIQNLYTPLSHNSFSVNLPAPFPQFEMPRSLEIVIGTGIVIEIGENQVASTSGAPSSQSQQPDGYSAGSLLSTHQSQSDLQASLAGNSLLFVSEHPQTIESSINNQPTSISGESQQSERYSEIKSLLNSPSKRRIDALGSPSKKQKTRTCSLPTEFQPASKTYETAISTKKKTRTSSCPAETFASRKKVTARSPMNKKETPSSSLKAASTSKEQTAAARPRHKKGTLSSPAKAVSASKEQTTAVRHRQMKGTPSSPATAASASNEQTSAVRPRQKEGTLSSPATAASASNEQMTAIRPRQKEGTLFSPAKAASASDEQMTVARPKQKKGELSSPVVTTSASREQVISDCPKEKTGPIPIPEEPNIDVNTNMVVRNEFPESSSAETSLTNPSSQHSEALQNTKIGKGVSRLMERLELFDKFRCVKCGVKFRTQDELLRHEPIHFHD